MDHFVNPHDGKFMFSIHPREIVLPKTVWLFTVECLIQVLFNQEQHSQKALMSLEYC